MRLIDWILLSIAFIGFAAVAFLSIRIAQIEAWISACDEFLSQERVEVIYPDQPEADIVRSSRIGEQSR